MPTSGRAGVFIWPIRLTMNRKFQLSDQTEGAGEAFHVYHFLPEHRLANGYPIISDAK